MGFQTISIKMEARDGRLRIGTADRLRSRKGGSLPFNRRFRGGGMLRVAPGDYFGCPSSDDLRQFGCFRKGGSGSSVVEIKRHAGDAANDDLRSPAVSPARISVSSSLLA